MKGRSYERAGLLLKKDLYLNRLKGAREGRGARGHEGCAHQGTMWGETIR